MSYHRKEVDKYLDYDDSTKINSRLELNTMDHNSAEVELQFYDVFDRNDNIIAETKIKVEFNEAGELETSTLDMLNQDPEFFEAVLQKKYDRDGEGQKVDFEGGYDEMFMEAVAGRVSEDIEHDIQQIMRMTNEAPEIDVDDIEIELEEITLKGFDGQVVDLRQAFVVNGEEIAFNYEIDDGNDEDMAFYQSHDGKDVEPEYEMYAPAIIEENEYSRKKLEEIFAGMDDSDVASKMGELRSKLDEMALDNYKSEIAKPEEPKQKQKKSKGFGMSM